MAFVSYAQNYEDVMLHRVFKFIEKGFYIDVGAADSVHDSVTKIFYERGWNGINIEPLPESHQKLMQDRSRDINLPVAVIDLENQKDLDFYCVDDTRVHAGLSTGLSTLQPELAEKYYANGCTIKKISVPTMTLTQICNKYVQQQEIHFLKIDVENFEEKVLRGMSFSSYRPWIIIVEATKPNSSEINSEQWEKLILEAKYECVYFDGLNKFYVSHEKRDLKKHFLTPPNVFDGFIQANLQNLQEQFEIKEKTIAQLQHTLTEKESELSNTQQLIQSKDAETTQLQTILNNKDNEVTHLHKTISEKESDNRQFQQTLNDKNLELDQLRTILSTKDTALNDAQQLIQTKDNELTHLQKISIDKDYTLNTLYENIAAKDSELFKFQNILSEKEQKLLDVINSVKEKDNQLNSMHQTLIEKENAWNAASQTLQEKLSEKNSNLNTLQQNIKIKNEELVWIHQVAQEKEKLLIEKNRQLKEYEGMLNTSQQNIKIKDEKLALIYKTAQEKEILLQQVSHQLQEHKIALNTARKDIKIKDEAFISIQKDAQEKEKSIEKSLQVHENFQKTLARRESELQSLRHELHAIYRSKSWRATALPRKLRSYFTSTKRLPLLESNNKVTD